MHRQEAAEIFRAVVIDRTRRDVPPDVAEAMDVALGLLGRVGDQELDQLRWIEAAARRYVELEVADDPNVIEPGAALNELARALGVAP